MRFLQGKTFNLHLLSYPEIERKNAWSLSLRGCRYSWWCSHWNGTKDPEHLSEKCRAQGRGEKGGGFLCFFRSTKPADTSFSRAEARVAGVPIPRRSASSGISSLPPSPWRRSGNSRYGAWAARLHRRCWRPPRPASRHPPPYRPSDTDCLSGSQHSGQTLGY